MKPFLFLILIILLSCQKNKFEDYCEYDGPLFEEKIKNDSIQIYIPTGFTPNQDGYNDIYYFVTKGILKFDVKIKKGFKTLYEVKNSNSEWYWDGSNSKGEIKDGEYEVEATLYAYDGEIINLKTKIASAQDYSYLPCSCSRRDQIDPDYGFILQAAESCSNY